MARICEDCASAILTSWDDGLMTVHSSCLTLYIEKKIDRLSVQPKAKLEQQVDQKRALLVITARLLGATHRRLATLFEEVESQKVGEELITEAEKALSLTHGLVDEDEVDKEFRRLALELDWHEG